MEFTEKQLQNLQKVAFDYAFYRTGNLNISEDISSQTISLFLLSFKRNTDEKKWIINTTKNYCKKYFSKVTREQKNRKKYGSELIAKFSEHSDIESDKELVIAFKDSFETLSEMELQTILYYFKCNENIIEMSENLTISYATIRKRISRIKNKLKAETYLRLGYYGTKKIVTPQLNNLIVKFLNRFKENIEKNSLKKMHYYFSAIDIEKYKHNIKINKIIDYDIELKNSVYKAWVFYENNQDIAESFFVEFYVDNTNHLRIISPPTKKDNLVVIKSDSIEGKKLLELLAKYPEDKTGRPNIPKEEIERILKQFEEKQKDQSKK